ncbi:MAG: hypothetical protein ACLPV4_20615 [Solirubrobacteraceae bacterium]
MPAIVTLMSGERYRLTGCCADLAPQINTARAEGLLVELTRDVCPVESLWVHPDAIATIKDEA